MLSQGSLEMHMKRHIYLIMRGSSGKIRDPNSSRAQPRYLPPAPAPGFGTAPNELLRPFFSRADAVHTSSAAQKILNLASQLLAVHLVAHVTT